MLSPANVAAPLTAFSDVVPERVPPPGFVPMATVTLPPNAVAVFPWASCAVTCTAGVIAAPAVVLVGGTVNASCVAAPGVTLKAALVCVSPAAPAVRVYALPTLLMLNPGNAATPPTAATVVVPARVPPPGFEPIATVTFPEKAVTVFPWASCPVTWTAGAIVAPATTFVGWTVKTSCTSAPTCVSPTTHEGFSGRPDCDGVTDARSYLTGGGRGERTGSDGNGRGVHTAGTRGGATPTTMARKNQNGTKKRKRRPTTG